MGSIVKSVIAGTFGKYGSQVEKSARNERFEIYFRLYFRGEGEGLDYVKEAKRLIAFYHSDPCDPLDFAKVY